MGTMNELPFPVLTGRGPRISGTATPSANDANPQPCAVFKRRRRSKSITWEGQQVFEMSAGSLEVTLHKAGYGIAQDPFLHSCRSHSVRNIGDLSEVNNIRDSSATVVEQRSCENEDNGSMEQVE